MAPLARAQESSAPVAETSDWTEPNQVLEIPQQCDKAAVAILCDRESSRESSGESNNDGSPASADDSAAVETASVNLPNTPDTPTDPDSEANSATPSAESAPGSASEDDDGSYGSIDDYQNQYADAGGGWGPSIVAVPFYVPVAPIYTYYVSPRPIVVGPGLGFSNPHFLSPLPFTHSFGGRFRGR